MSEIILPPNAHALLNSVRSVGYSLETAVADLIDNSISAGAKKISIRYSPHDNPYVAVLDDGLGMESDELTSAMRHGSKDPEDARSVKDLGRFGLGLKTASLSQCRKLTVISLKNGSLSGRCWDLDLIAQRKDWVLCVPETEDIKLLPLADDLLRQGQGTVVVWQHLDKLEAGESSINKALGEKMDIVREHIALVFHRYISGDPITDIEKRKELKAPVL
ncbi:ATP-binding protein [Candidatus Magnetominusculus dajiuhuensis]|uniref:ATP-binding protein n=1 Tax=Candidatus Magnetominusculus dajiuhuensis TaxID=3137712 RepID=UPI003B42A3CE